MKVIRLSALHTGRLYPPRNIPGTHSCWRLSQYQGHIAAGRIMSMKNSSDIIGNRTRNLPACSAVPQPTAPPRASLQQHYNGLSTSLKRECHFSEHVQKLDTIIYTVKGRREFIRYRDWLRAGRSGDRIPVGTRYSAPVQTGPGAHPPSYTTGTASFPGVKRPGRGVDHPSPLRPRLKEE